MALKEKIEFSIDLLISATVKEIAEETGQNTNVVLPEFLSSLTGKVLLDESTKIWWNGPSYLAEMYFDEIEHNGAH